MGLSPARSGAITRSCASRCASCVTRVGHLRRRSTRSSKGSGSEPRRHRSGEDIGGGHGVLHREIDTDPTDRRHRVRRVADDEKAGAKPAFEPVDRHIQQLDVVPAMDRLIHRGGLGPDRADAVAERFDPARADMVGGALGHDKGALPIVAAIDQHEHAPGIEHAERGILLGRRFRDAEPEHVHRRADRGQRQAGAKTGVAAVTGDDQPRVERLSVPRTDPDDAAVLRDRLGPQAFQPQREAGMTPRCGRDEIEKLPLRHQRDKGCGHAQLREIREIEPMPGDSRADATQLLVRPIEQFVEQPQFRKHAQRRGVDGVAAEIAQEVAMFFEHRRRQPGAGEQ